MRTSCLSDSGLVHVTHVGQWNVSSRDEYGGLKYIIGSYTPLVPREKDMLWVTRFGPWILTLD